MKKIMFSLIFSLILVSAAWGQAQVWVARYSGPGNFNDIAYAMTLDAAGNIYVTGTSSGSPNYDIVTIKYNSSGTQQWLSVFNGGSHDAAYAIVVDNSGNVYVTGSSNQGLGSDYVTIKYNSSGAQQWVQYYEGPAFEEDIADGIAVDNSGNVYITGYSTGNQTNFDYATIKYNSNGIEQWVIRFNAPGDVEDVAAALVLDGSGNIYVTGRSNYNFTTIKYNTSGVQQWLQSYSEPGSVSNSAISMKMDGSGNLYISGISALTTNNYDYTTVKYNSSGQLIWAQSYSSPGTSTDVMSSLALDNLANVYVTGRNTGDFATIKYNSSGVQQWVSTYNGPGNAFDEATSITVDSSGNSYVTGTSYGNATTQYDFATVKYNPSGVQQWVQRYNGPGNFYDTPYSIAVDGSGNVYVSGSSGGSGTGLDYATLRYSQLTGLQSPPNEIPAEFKLYQNYPNPFNPTTKIKFSIPPYKGGQGDVSLIIYDVLGKQVQTLVNGTLSPSAYEVSFDGSNLPSGVYYYRLEAGDYTDTKKLVLIK